MRQVMIYEHYDPTTERITLFGTVEKRPAASQAFGADTQGRARGDKIRATVEGWSEEEQAAAYLYLHGRGVNLADAYGLRTERETYRPA
jgi:hypothetical protein